MGKLLNEVAEELKSSNKKVHLIYAFNGTGKTRLSREFKTLISDVDEHAAKTEKLSDKRILYYNAFTEDLFYWDNDLENDVEPRLMIHSNVFTKWIFETQGQDQNIIHNFKNYTDENLIPKFNYNFTEIVFHYYKSNIDKVDNIKISKGEESNFIWCVFYTLFDQIIEELNGIKETDYEEDEIINEFSKLEYIYIDDPITSLDDNHLIRVAIDLAELIKKSESNKLKFVITTHNPLFYNVLYNELSRKDNFCNYKPKQFKSYRLIRENDGTFLLKNQNGKDDETDSPFSYHLFLKNEIEKAIENGELKKYHFNFLRNILEKTATFLGHKGWVELLPKDNDGRVDSYHKRVLNLSSHSKHSGEEVAELSDDEKRIISYFINEINEKYHFNKKNNIGGGNDES